MVSGEYSQQQDDVCETESKINWVFVHGNEGTCQAVQLVSTENYTILK